MKPFSTLIPLLFMRAWQTGLTARRFFLFFICILTCCGAEPAIAQSQGNAVDRTTTSAAQILSVAGKVEVSRIGSDLWDPAYTNQLLQAGDRLRTGARSRATVRLSPLTVIPVGELTVLQIPAEKKELPGFSLLRGILYFFHRDRPGQFRFETPSVASVIRGTEFTLRVADDGTTTIQVLDGQVHASNDAGDLVLNSGEAARVAPGKAPERTAVITSIHALQWCLYYPAVVDLQDLAIGPESELEMTQRDSIQAYREGDLLLALARYSFDRQSFSTPENIYLAALLLAVGNVEESQNLLRPMAATAEPRLHAVMQALQTLIATVHRQPFQTDEHWAETASGALAKSYARQADGHLAEALAAARAAVRLSPEFGFAWARVAELEFSFGRIDAAERALDKSLQLAPRNAQSVALRGFLWAARNETAAAIARFEEAIGIDPRLGNAWLGRALCRIRQGDREAGRQDLQMAAALEPQRAFLRSYLAKAFQVSHELHLAAKEIELAQRLDPGDPTAWLYAALIHQQQNQINEAVRNLERSQELNDHRQLYRSSLLLDQDRAVRSANLAGVYQDAGFADLSVREAGRAVASDYANYSAHLFLAASYDRLRDPRQINLRYETAWLSEYLVANLLSPVGAGTLSPYISQQEYGKLFERDRLGFASSTEYSSRGDWFQTASQFGLFGNTSYAVDAVYRSENGHRPNNDLEHLTLSLQVKQQLSGHDTLYFQTIYYNAAAGDVSPYYDERAANHQLRTSERQEPIALAGWHHEWQPGIHTLFLAGYLDDTLLVNNPQQQTLLLQQDGQGLVTAILPGTIQQAYRSELEMLSFEGQQIFQTDDHAFIMGGRYQSGKFDVRNNGTIEANSFVNSQGFGVPPAWFRFPAQRIEPSFERWNGYAYLQWQCLDPLRIMGGITLDRLTVPENFRFAPLSSEERTSDFVSPKFGLVWTPFAKTTVRAAFSRSVSGASIDQSFQLEPTQVAGFNQAWRSLIPEAVAAANAGAEFETLSLSIDQNISSGTYFGLTLERLNSDLEREIGVFTFPPPQTFAPPWIFPAQTPSQLDFEERSLVLTLYQLVGNAWSMGFSYRVSRANLRDTFRDIPADAPAAYDFRPHREVAATLHQANPFVRFHHPRGWFAKADAWWNAQANEGYAPGLPGDDFWQFHAHIGYRFAQRRAEVSLGLLNMTGQDYQLNPLNFTAELPHERTLWFSLRLNF